LGAVTVLYALYSQLPRTKEGRTGTNNNYFMLYLQTDIHIASQNIHANTATVSSTVGTVSAMWC
jgi:hypothetical protein